MPEHIFIAYWPEFWKDNPKPRIMKIYFEPKSILRYTIPKEKSMFVLGLLLIALTIFTSSCRKDKTRLDDESSQIDLTQGFYSDSFDWSTIRILELEISSPVKTIVDITSVDGSVRFHRGMHLGNDSNYDLKISIPKTLKQLMINGDTVSAQSSHITYSIQQ